MPVAPTGGTIAGVVEHHIGLAPVAHRKGEAAGDGDTGPDRRDDWNAVAVRTAHVHVAVASLGQARGASHVLREDLLGSDAADQQGGHVPVRGREPVAGAGKDGAPDGNRFLTSSCVTASNYLALAVELIFDAILQLPHQEHVVVEALAEVAVELGL